MTLPVIRAPLTRVDRGFKAVSSSLICGAAVVVVGGAMPGGFGVAGTLPVMQPHRIPRPGRFASSFRRRVRRRVSVPTESDRPYVVPPVVLPAAEQAEVAVAGALAHAGSSPISLADKGVTPAPNPAQRPGHRCRLSPGIARLTRHTENHVDLTSLTIGPSPQQRQQRFPVAGCCSRRRRSGQAVCGRNVRGVIMGLGDALLHTPVL